MNHDPFPPDELDELATAVVDGVATNAQRARAEAEPLAAERVAALADLRERLHDPVLVAPSTKESHLAAAIATFDELHQLTPAPPDAGPAGVHHLDDARRRRHRRWVPALSVAAASVLVLGTGMLVLDGGGGGGGADVAPLPEAPATTVAPATVAGAADVSRSAPADGAGGESETSPKVAAAPAPASETADEDATAMESVVVGDAIPFAAPVEVDSEEQLPATVDSYSTAALNPPAVPATDPCPGAGRTYVADVVWQGQPAHLYVLPDLVTRTSAVVLDLDCATLASAELTG